jgi:hypothetical protein
MCIAVLAACGNDDNTDPRDASAESGSTGGRDGAAGADAGRIDTNTGGGGSAGASDAAVERGIDVSGASDGGSDVAPDRGLDAGGEPDAGSIVDSTFDHAGSDGAIEGGDAGDAVMVDAVDDGVFSDTADGDVSASDASDALDAPVIDAGDAPPCNDGNAATVDFLHPTYGCGHKFDANPSDNDAWITYDVGFHVDVATGLGWAFPAGSRNAAAAAAACLAFDVAGLGDWRMATIDDARLIAAGCATTAAGGSCPLDDPSCLSMVCGQASPACEACTGGQGPNSGAYCKVDVAVCTHFHTSSICTDCGDAGVMDWIYGTSNGNFLPFNSLSGIPTACVSAVPGGVPAADGG